MYVSKLWALGGTFAWEPASGHWAAQDPGLVLVPWSLVAMARTESAPLGHGPMVRSHEHQA